MQATARTRIRWPNTAAVAAVLGLAGAAVGGESAPPVTAAPVRGTMTVDGHLTEAGWQTAQWATGFHPLDRPTDLAQTQTRFAVLFDASHVYVGIAADEPDAGAIQAAIMDRDGPVYRDDCVEVMIDATGERVEYYHFVVNARGTLYDAQLRQGGHVRSAAWNSTAMAAAAISGAGWTVELALPLVELGLTPASVGDWAINVARERHAGAEELSTYAPLSGGFHQATQYARLRLPGADMERFRWELGYPQAEAVTPDAADQPVYTAACRLTNGTGSQRSYRVRGIVGQTRGPWLTGRLAAGQSQETRIIVPKPALGPSLLRLELAADDTNRLVAVRQLAVDLKYVPLAVEIRRPAYRATIYATESVSEAVCQVRSDLPPARLQGLQLETTLWPADAGPDGGADRPLARDARAASPRALVHLPVADLPPGSYWVQAALREGGGGTIRHTARQQLRKLAPMAQEWRLDADLVLRHNGTAVLPFGWFSMPPEALADTGHAFTVVQSYSGYWQSVEELRHFLDQVVTAGSAATLYPYPYPEFVTDEAWRRPLTEVEEHDLRQRVRALRDHPGLFAWYMADEPELVPALPARCRRIYEVIREEDSAHPCIMLNDTEDGLRDYREGGDVLMPDPYPLFLQGGGAAQPLDKVARFMRAAAVAADSHRAVWVTPQAFNYGDYGRENNRAPRLLELRNQLYQAAVYGARGFLWYTYSQARNYPDLDLGLRWLSREAAELAPWLLAPEAPPPMVQASRPDQMHAALRHANDAWVLIAVNTDTSVQEVRFKLPASVRADSFRVVSEDRAVPVAGRYVHDSFGPYATHVYTTGTPLAGREDLTAVTAAIARADAARRRPGNLAFETYGTHVAVSSSATYGSTPTRLTDGITDGMAWIDGTPTQVPDWVRVEWPERQRLRRLVLWANGVATVEARLPAPAGDRVVGRGSWTGGDSVVVDLDETVATRSLQIVVTANPPGQRSTVVYEIEAYGE